MDLLPGVPLHEHPHPWLVDLGLVLNCPNTPHRRVTDQVKETLPLMQAKAEEYGEQGLYKWWFFNPYRLPFVTRPFVFINDPIMVPQVLGSKAFGKFDRGMLFSMAQPLVGGSFLAAPDGDTWKYQRRLVQPGFSQKSLAETTRTTTELLEKELLSAWDEYAGTSNPISVLPWMQRMAIDVLGRVAFSHSFDGVASFAPPQSIEVAEKSTPARRMAVVSVCTKPLLSFLPKSPSVLRIRFESSYPMENTKMLVKPSTTPFQML
jgi:cytochrome P450